MSKVPAAIKSLTFAAALAGLQVPAPAVEAETTEELRQQTHEMQTQMKAVQQKMLEMEEVEREVQVQGDSGDGATSGNFKGDAWGMGPSFQYVVSKKPISIINFEWVSDVYTNKRVDWDTFVLFWAMEF